MLFLHNCSVRLFVIRIIRLTTMQKKFITLEHGAGGEASWRIVEEMRKILTYKKKWFNTGDDGAVYDLGNQKLVFTTDAFIVEPIFFPGGDIGKIAACGSINDVAVMGAEPIGLSLSIVMEEGFSKSDLDKILKSINKVSEESGVPIVTGDTKVTDKGKLDKIEITTACVGLAEKAIDNKGAKPGDKIIVSADLGEHGVTLLATRFNYKTRLKSDCQPLVHEMQAVGKYLSSCKDPTRGGLAANLNEMVDKAKVKAVLDEKLLPYKKDTKAISEMLGIDIFSLPSEGRFIATVPARHEKTVIQKLKRFNKEAKVIGEIQKGRGLYLKTGLGSMRKVEMPSGKLIPRIC